MKKNKEKDCKYSKDNVPAIYPSYCIPAPRECEGCKHFKSIKKVKV